MTPAGLHILEEMPLTRNGKIDRAALASLDPLTARTGANILAPQTGVQRRIAAIWEQLLGVERVGLEDNFFDLGGHSLLLVQLQRRLRDEFKTEISVLDVFQRSTVAGLAEYFKRKNIESKPEPQFDQARERAGKIRKAVNSQKKSAKAWKGSNERK
jgi:acyl carrier protein